jgi:hypothetical protein
VILSQVTYRRGEGTLELRGKGKGVNYEKMEERKDWTIYRISRTKRMEEKKRSKYGFI